MHEIIFYNGFNLFVDIVVAIGFFAVGHWLGWQQGYNDVAEDVTTAFKQAINEQELKNNDISARHSGADQEV